MCALLQSVCHRDPAVKYETLAVPSAVGFRYLFEVFQNAAFQMVDILDPFTVLRDGPDERHVGPR